MQPCHRLQRCSWVAARARRRWCRANRQPHGSSATSTGRLTAVAIRKKRPSCLPPPRRRRGAVVNTFQWLCSAGEAGYTGCRTGYHMRLRDNDTDNIKLSALWQLSGSCRRQVWVTTVAHGGRNNPLTPTRRPPRETTPPPNSKKTFVSRSHLKSSFSATFCALFPYPARLETRASAKNGQK